MRRVANLLLLALSVSLGYLLVGVLVPPYAQPSGIPAPISVPPKPEPEPTTSTTGTTIQAEDAAYLVWATGGLPPELIEGMLGAFEQVSIVKGDLVELATDHGVIPLDAVALDPAAHAPFDALGEVAALRPGTVLLGESSARLRQEVVGDVLLIDGIAFEVAGVVEDETVGAAEVVFDASDPVSPVRTDRFALVATDQSRSDTEELIRSLYDGQAPLRIRVEGETPWLRHGDAVLPQVFVKEALGEFSYEQRSGSGLVQNPEFLEEMIVASEVPILGQVVCHRIVLEQLTGAMAQLIQEGLAHLVNPSGFAGCWNPRFIGSSKSAGLSRHAWGAAVDLNASENPVGSAGNQDPRLIDVMRDWGFTWGGQWLVPDPMHFEYRGGPG